MARKVHGTLTPNVVETVTLDGDAQFVEVVNRNGLGEVFYLMDSAVDPVIAADDTEILLACMNGQVSRSLASGETTVKLISASAVDYTVRIADGDPQQ